MKLNVLLTIAFHLVSLTCPLSFGKIAEQHGSVQHQEVLLEMLKGAGKKKVFYESFLLVSFFYVVNQEKPTILSTRFIVSELDLWLVIFATSASSLNCRSPSSLAHG